MFGCCCPCDNGRISNTDYRKRIQYQTYDVTELLTSGENEMTFLLADGWYRGSCGAWGMKNQYGTETKLLAQLEITDNAEKVTTVCTDGSWDWCSDGPIRFADNKNGEGQCALAAKQKRLEL